MNTQAMQTFSAVLALAALAGVLILLLANVAPGFSAVRSAGMLAREHAMRFALLLAGGSMAGSLWFSEVVHYAPCKLCWYQRVCMYSIAIISLVAVVRREKRAVAPYVLTLSVMGLVVSTYHFLLEWFPQWESSVCSLDVPCTTVWFRKFGFLTLPGMAWIAFAGCALVMVTVMRGPDDNREFLTNPNDTEVTEN